MVLGSNYAQTTPTTNSASTARQLVINSRRSTNSLRADSTRIFAFMSSAPVVSRTEHFAIAASPGQDDKRAQRRSIMAKNDDPKGPDRTRSPDFRHQF